MIVEPVECLGGNFNWWAEGAKTALATSRHGAYTREFEITYDISHLPRLHVSIVKANSETGSVVILVLM